MLPRCPGLRSRGGGIVSGVLSPDVTSSSDGPTEPTREAAHRAAALANSVLEETSNLSAVNLVGQVRMTAVDLLRSAGVERAAAQEAVRNATLRAVAAES